MLLEHGAVRPFFSGLLPPRIRRCLLSDGAVAGGETLRRQTGGGVSQVDGLRQFCVRHHAVGEVLKAS